MILCRKNCIFCGSRWKAAGRTEKLSRQNLRHYPDRLRQPETTSPTSAHSSERPSKSFPAVIPPRRIFLSFWKKPKLKESCWNEKKIHWKKNIRKTHKLCSPNEKKLRPRKTNGNSAEKIRRKQKQLCGNSSPLPVFPRMPSWRTFISLKKL